MMVRGDSGIKSIDDIKKREVAVSSTGRGSPTFIYPTMLNNTLGTKFKVVLGYKGSASGRLALERGEVIGLTSAWTSWKATSRQWIDQKFIVPVVEVALEKSSDLPKSVPLVLDLARTDEDRALLEFMAAPTFTGRALAVPPGLPKERLAALRRAYDLMVKDAKFLADAERRKIDIVPLSGEKVEQRIRATANASPAIVKRAKAALGYK
jgi:tripartite-type tricarboxylate transporter receptor subunit TctC